MAPAQQRRPAQPSPALTAAMAGAVDLAAVKARSEAAARAAEAPAPTAGQYVVDVTETSFQAEVLDRSFQVPVLLSLWSARSPASDQLNATLEQLTTQQAGALVLAKIEVDANMGIAQALQLRGVPAVFAVIGGQLVPGFEGALPEPQLREFVGAVLQAGREAGLSAAAPAADAAADAAEPQQPEDPRFDAAEAALADGDYALAAERFQAILDAEPGNAQAALALRQVALLARVAELDPAAATAAGPDDVAGQLAAADLEMAGGDAEAALQRLLALIVRVTGDERDQVRLRLVDYFDLLGPDDPLVPPARRQMARALF
ncbi:MAG TPA: tetratricopeptide repeat protein [Jatrophihabitantaceae bacterium]|jgi:putative thioredoxin|nr:tetratricopeptide repeat protein [Jatrophihabitantaceae bacterium]